MSVDNLSHQQYMGKYGQYTNPNQWSYYYPQPYVRPNVCPGCGQCNTCGRSVPQPLVRPYQPFWTVTTAPVNTVGTATVGTIGDTTGP